MALALPHARADATLPNGAVVPVDSGGETQIYEYFTAEAEAIDWIADAHTTPDTFSPLCGFTATLVLKQSGSSLAVGWYNVIPGATTAPAATDIHAIVPAGSAVGTTVTGATIRGDMRYLGGLIGFALIRVPPHFTESKWNTQCTLCATPGPWLLSLTYKSVNIPNAFYVAFEDGNTTNIGWSNDGDYNDYVFRFTGLTCAGAGEPCEVDGAKGACVDGLTECDASGVLSCKMLVAAQDETCDGVDNDCDARVDDGKDLCPVGKQCVRGTCVPPCGEEFPCFGDDACEAGLCVNPRCVGKTCASGEACIDGECSAPCDGVKCPGTQECRVGRCVDPCADVKCADGYACDRGACLLHCSCGGCPAGLACAANGVCAETGCESQSCDEGTFCVGGACVDACQGAVCPRGEVCNAGRCESAADAGVPSTGGADDAGPTTNGNGGFGRTDAGAAVADAGGVRPLGRRGDAGAAGCGCRIAAPSGSSASSRWLTLLLFACLLRRRARRRTPTSAH